MQRDITMTDVVDLAVLERVEGGGIFDVHVKLPSFRELLNIKSHNTTVKKYYYPRPCGK